VAGDIANPYNDMLFILEVHRSIITADFNTGPKMAEDLDVPAPLIGREHAPLDDLGNAEIALKALFVGWTQASGRKRGVGIP